MKVAALIMAGGHGERFWPASRTSAPKQFIGLLPGDRSPFQETYERAASVVGEENVFVITGVTHAGIALEQVPSLRPNRIVIEPAGRDTGPCLALGTVSILGKSGGNPVIVALPSDHYVPDVGRFRATIDRMIEVALDTGYIVTAGIKPTRPETAYGYMRAGSPLACVGVPPAYNVTQFIEKPPLDKALLLSSAGGWYWNGGILCYKASDFLDAYEATLPGDIAPLRSLLSVFKSNPNPEIHLYTSAFSRLTRISVDLGVMEKWTQVATVPADFPWDDLGSWSALERLYGNDDQENTIAGEAILVDSHNCTLVSEAALGVPVPLGQPRTLVAFGLSDTLVVDAKGVVLVCPKSRSAELKDLVRELSKLGRKDLIDGPEDPACQSRSAVSATLTTDREIRASCHGLFAGVQTPKPWGGETLWVKTDRFAGKIIYIRGGESLSLQYHERKSEAMACLSGYGFFSSNGTKKPFAPGDSEVVPPGTVHRIEAETDLTVLEISTPELDDVVRLQDRYGRV